MTKPKLNKLFQALGDPTRYKMVKIITLQPTICVSELASEVGITPAGASQHLTVLEKVGLVEPYRDGKKVCYKLLQGNANRRVLKLMADE
jgi:DNA-binding transcriptional ArsR family regulator